MKNRISILYSWLVRTTTYFLPNIPVLMRFRGFLYSLMMERCGKNFQIHSSALLVALSGLDFGHNVYIGANCVIICNNLQIRDEVLIGPNTVIASRNHTKIDGSYRFGPSASGKIVIQKGCWIAANCTVVSGAVLPKGSLLAAGSVLTKAYTIDHGIYAGSPAKLIKKDEGLINVL